MQCTICGTKLRPGAAICASCGAPTIQGPNDTGEDGTSHTPQESSTNILSPSPDSSSQKELQETSSEKEPAQNMQLTANGLQDHKMLQTLPEVSLGETSMDIPQTSPNQQVPVALQSLSTRLTVVFVILVVLIISGGGGFVYYATAFVPHELHIQATTVAQAVSTQQAERIIQTTATAGAITPLEIYTKSTSGNPTLTTLTSSQDSSAWEKVNGSDGTCNFTRGAYQALAPSAGGTVCVLKGSDFSNFAFQVQMTIVKGVGGIIFRADDTDLKWYALEIGSDRSFALIRFSGGLASRNIQILFLSFSAAILLGPNQLNIITVIALDSNLYLYVNGEPLAKVSDDTYSSGEIGVISGITKNSTDFIFSKAQVWNL